MAWVLVDGNGVIVNVIEYDGVSPYTPPVGLSLLENVDGCVIGDAAEEI